MYQGRSIFSQILDYRPRYHFQKCVSRYQGNYRSRSFTCFDQYFCMVFSQLTYRDSLRDTVCCLRAMQEKQYHVSIKGKVSRSTLADANKKRDWRIYCELPQYHIHQARGLYAQDDFGLQLDETAYALDSSTIDLYLSLFPWARFRSTKGGIKLHTLLNLRSNISAFVPITDVKVRDVRILDELVLEPGAIYVMDRGYLDFKRLHAINLCRTFFVIRSKTNTQLRRLYSAPVDQILGILYDQTVRLVVVTTAKAYPEKLRRIKYYDKQTDKQLIWEFQKMP